MADPTVTECGACGRRSPVDSMVLLRPEAWAPLVAHCPACADAWRRRFEAARERGMK